MVQKSYSEFEGSDVLVATVLTRSCLIFWFPGSTTLLKSLRPSLMAQAMTALQMILPSEDGMTGSSLWLFKQKVCSVSFGATATNDSTL